MSAVNALPLPSPSLATNVATKDISLVTALRLAALLVQVLAVQSLVGAGEVEIPMAAAVAAAAAALLENAIAVADKVT